MGGLCWVLEEKGARSLGKKKGQKILCNENHVERASCETCRQVTKQQLEPDMEKWTGSKLGKEYVKAVHCHSAYLTYI